ncbi:cytochrome c [Edaphobacter sp. 12200R-103]|jgi:hypothetical protein|uniref:c-type cytochrome n=1 Tax=Edaphobacter sp. 12200R-103 TaxID=2703788 RepID=UPI00138CE75E|nr:cytochrome c [Edaphobacter sp. 12200R-103]QHS51748.1 cytochrome c [Edaphobacter sp. 12200R-103]
MNLLRWIVLAGIFTMPFVVLGQSTSTSQTQASTPQKKQAQQPVRMNEGERVFMQNCSRCHNPPDGFSPRIAGSIVRHMRVRANLSERDAQALLRFFNP